MRLEQESEDRKQISPESEALIEVHEKLRHSPLNLPDGHYKYQITDNRIDCVISSDSYDVWSFSRTAPPSFALHDLENRNISKSLTQSLSVDIPYSLWLPVTVLIETGRFKRMQDWTHVLSCKTAPGVSTISYHIGGSRQVMPDPSGTQARFIAWQLFSHLCKAVQIAHLRGLHAPRRFSKHLGFVLGFHRIRSRRIPSCECFAACPKQ